MPEIEARAAQLTADIQARPVNLVAIEEYKELEERYTFLRAQEQDLLKSKEQILELIAMINKKSSEMFQSTFEQANANFEAMFTKLFNGGQAKLVLLENAADPLECASTSSRARPASVRSRDTALGGERTMTAVSLLFAIFMIKPAPSACWTSWTPRSTTATSAGSCRRSRLPGALAVPDHHAQPAHPRGSDIVYGVTQQEGISKIVSMRSKRSA